MFSGNLKNVIPLCIKSLSLGIYRTSEFGYNLKPYRQDYYFYVDSVVVLRGNLKLLGIGFYLQTWSEAKKKTLI